MTSVVWNTDEDWDRFRPVSVSGQNGEPPDNTLILTGSSGTGHAQGSGGSHANDRRIFLIDGIEGADVEMYATCLLLTQQAQFGLVARVHAPTDVGFLDDYSLHGLLGFCATARRFADATADAFAHPGAAPIGWNNIFLFGDSLILLGVWEFAANGLLAINQAPVSVPAQDQAIDSASGDGTTVTVVSAVPHHLPSGQQVQLDFGPFADTAFTPVVVDPVTFTVESAQTGSWDTGRWRIAGVPVLKGPGAQRRRVGMRVVGDDMTLKQWFVDFENEPDWDDPWRARTVTLPAQLAASGRRPPAAGGVGIVISHLDGNRSLEVADLDITIFS